MATTMSQPPSIPPRPSKTQEKGSNDTKAPPKIPPRPSRNLERKISEDRFAPSPLSGGFPKNPKTDRFSPGDDVDKFSSEHHEHHDDRPGSVSMPSLGEEGSEYAAAVGELQGPEDPEQTRTVGGDMKLHAPKPSLPVQSAKQRVAAVTRTDSARAASFGLGTESPLAPSTHKKSTTSHLSSEDGRDMDEESATPDIGQRVPMYRDAGDVQAPSPAPRSLSPRVEKGKHHQRSLSGQTGDYPPGSYGLRGHGHVSTDKLEKAYYDKHPDQLQKELTRRYHDRQNDFAMSKNELNQVIRETASHGSGLGTSNFQGTPTEEIGFQAHDEYASRVASPGSGLAAAQAQLGGEVSPNASKDKDTIHVDERRDAITNDSTTEQWDRAPILADDEVANYPPRFELHAAVEPSPEVPVEHEEPTSRPTSRHSSRPTSAHTGQVPEFDITPLEDVKEYEPLFSEEGKETEPLPSPSIDRASAPLRFPSKDIWEDAPSSAHYTAEVTTPNAGEAAPKRAVPDRSIPTPAQAFAKHQEELAEKEAQRMQNFVPRGDAKGSSWLPLQPVVVAAEEPQQRPPSQQRRFPSRDVWEDAPESHLYQTTVSSDQVPESPIELPDVPLRPTRSKEKPAVPGRPKPKTTPSDEARAKPAVSDKPKPHIPARPAKSGSTSSESRESPVPKAKPAIPSKPAGGKIAALQAGFMSDLNKRLQLGPLPPKKEEPRSPVGDDQEAEAPKKMPLSDARKGRARGPQRRAPARSPAPPVAAAAETTKPGVPSLSFSAPHVVWSIDPEDSDLSVKAADSKEAPKNAPKGAPKPDAAPDVSPKSESPGVDTQADTPTPPSSDEPQDSSKAEPEPLDAKSPTEVSPKEDILEVATSEEASADDVTAKPDVPAVEALEEDVLEVDRLGDLPTPEKGSSAPVLPDGVKEGDAEKVEVDKEA